MRNTDFGSLTQTCTLQKQNCEPWLQRLSEEKKPELSNRQPHLGSKLSFSKLLEPANAMQHLLICWRAPLGTRARKCCQRLQVAALHSAGEAGMNTKSMITRMHSTSPYVNKLHRIWNCAVFTTSHQMWAGASSLWLLALRREGTCVRHSLLLFPVPTRGMCLWRC